ncbi:MAG: hypothetical protein J6L69_00055, partial [Lachnospiraceae bacterium]|nr:hypothetical protein [Lachnospiraceae bacterium]
MIHRLQNYFTKRIPINIRKKNDEIYIQLQCNVANKDGLNAGMYVEMYKISGQQDRKYVGKIILDKLKYYHEIADMQLEDVTKLTNMTMQDYEEYAKKYILEFLNEKDYNDVEKKFLNCWISYRLETNDYEICLGWIKKHGNKYYHESSNSLGDKKVMTFDTPLVFDDNVKPEVLGSMLFEAFERCQMLTDRASGEFYARKEIDLLDESKLTYEEPRDKHFVDFEDGGVAEIYQIYSYLPSEDAESSCDIYLGIASEIDCNIEEENVKTSWEKYYGKATDFVYEECKKGIFTHRAEIKNSKAHKISYLLKQDEELVLECSYVLHQPSRRKKLNEKLQEVFEKF